MYDIESLFPKYWRIGSDTEEQISSFIKKVVDEQVGEALKAYADGIDVYITQEDGGLFVVANLTDKTKLEQRFSLIDIIESEIKNSNLGIPERANRAISVLKQAITLLENETGDKALIDDAKNRYLSAEGG